MHNRRLLACATLALLTTTAATAPGAILFDFGTGTGAPTTVSGAAAVDSPGHATGAVPASQTTWNGVAASDLAAGSILNGDGSPATSVALNLGHEATNGSNLIDFAAGNAINSTSVVGSSSVALGTIYADAGPPVVHKAASDAIFRLDAGTTNNAAIGLRIDGLPAGTYTLYYVGRNTNNTSARPIAFYTTVVPTATTSFNFTGLTAATVLNANASGNNAWTLGNQYNTATVTVGADQSIFVAAEGTGGGDVRGFINSVEIVPEPASAAVLLLAAGQLLLGRRRLHTV